jgi:hypothetical protein
MSCLSVVVFLSDFEVVNGHDIKEKEANSKRESENYSEGGKESVL